MVSAHLSLKAPQIERWQAIQDAFNTNFGPFEAALMFKSFPASSAPEWLDDKFLVQWQKMFAKQGYIASTSLMIPDVPFVPFFTRDTGMLLLSPENAVGNDVYAICSSDANLTEISAQENAGLAITVNAQPRPANTGKGVRVFSYHPDDKKTLVDFSAFTGEALPKPCMSLAELAQLLRKIA